MRRTVCLLLFCTGMGMARPLPYERVGLNRRQAAAFLLQRFTYGPRPGDVDRVSQTGPETWLERQLQGALPDKEVEVRLAELPGLAMSPQQIREEFISRQRLIARAEKEGLPRFLDGDEEERQVYERQLRAFKQERELSTLDDLQEELRAQKLLRACYGQNQLREILTDFWFNHFNVAALSDPVRFAVLPYERDVLRPGALGRFESLLQGTARHPAMLYYLNNNVSSAMPGRRTTLNVRYDAAPSEEQPHLREGQPLKRKFGGLNENYAREVMELHTLGVDGGYTQTDVTELARILSGWTVLYPETEQPRLRTLLEPGSQLGYEWQGDFLFRADWHDAEGKTLLGTEFPAGGGPEEGERALHLLALHPSTARFLSKKLAQRFVCDEPSEELVRQLAATYTRSGGDISAVLREIAYSPDFWAEAAHPSKLKSPLEFFVSCVRVSGAEYAYHPSHFYWLRRLGEPIYQCVPPTGFPEDSRFWASTSTVVQRANLANVLVANRVPKVVLKLPPGGPEPAQVLAPHWLPEQSLPLTEFAAAKVARPGDGYPPQRAWFRPRPPIDLARRREEAITVKVAALLLASPQFQLR